MDILWPESPVGRQPENGENEKEQTEEVDHPQECFRYFIPSEHSLKSPRLTGGLQKKSF
jgi:hypothetical protein